MHSHPNNTADEVFKDFLLLLFRRHFLRANSLKKCFLKVLEGGKQIA